MDLQSEQHTWTKMEGKSEIASTAGVEIRNPSGGFQDKTTGGEEKNERNKPKRTTNMGRGA